MVKKAIDFWTLIRILAIMTSLEKTILAANKLFVKEGPEHDLYVAPYGYNPSMFKLASTSGTVYFVGSKNDCLNRQDDLLLFALYN